MKTVNKLPRREFLRLSAFSGASLALGYIHLSGGGFEVVKFSSPAVPGMEINPYVFIDKTGMIFLCNHRPEMGQGTFQSIPMIIAEELEVDINQVKILASPADSSKYGDQMVVGSRSIHGNFEPMLRVGASAREMLLKAAADKWNVSPEECMAKKGNIIHRPSGRQLSYGALAEAASKLDVPKNPRLKNPSEYTIIGQSVPRSDIPSKLNGEARFGIDAVIPGMLYASIEHSPVFLGKIASFNDAKARAIPGVKHVFKTSRNVWGHSREGVAVLAENYWAALQGRKLLEIVWDNGDLESWSTQKIKDNYKAAAKGESVSFRGKGDFESAWSGSKNKIEAAYETPYQTHAPMEPMNALVSVEKDRCVFWGSTQNPNGTRSQLSAITNLPESKVEINYTFMGGAFGRKSMTDVVEEAADLSIQSGAPVKVIWTREDDLTQGPFRACSLNVFKGALDDQGNPLALQHLVVAQEIQNQTGKDNRASGSIAGGINTEYAIPNYRIAGMLQKFHIPITYWRSVYHSTNCFAHESFIDEMAHLAKKDPLDFRLAMLKEHRRYTQVLNIVARHSGWYQSREKNIAKGVAIMERSGSFVAMVTEISVAGGKVKPVKITCAVDCGRIVNPDTIRAQSEGCIVMGLTATYKSAITIEKGRVVQQNFDTYKMLRLEECPEIEVIVVPSEDSPEGVGEAALPAVAPSLTNAIFAATGKRIRTLPFNLDEI